MNSKIGLIFDMDGVITDTVPLHFKAWKKMFAEYGIRLTFAMYKDRVDGIPRLDGARAILSDLSDKDLEVAAEKKQAYFSGLLKTEKIDIYEDALKFVLSLPRHNYALAVATSSKNCREILKKIEIIDLFDAIVDGYGFKQGKPHPEIFLNAAKLIKVDPRRAVVFEDAKKGVEAAKNGNMFCVGVDRVGSPAILHLADVIINNFGDLDMSRVEEKVKKTP